MSVINILDAKRAIDALKASGEEEPYVFIARPGYKLSDAFKLYLATENIDVIRTEAAPIESFYVLTRKAYEKYE